MSVVDVLIYYRLAEKMQSLFTIFASHIVVHAAQVLKDNNKQITGNIPIGFLQLFTALNQNMQFLILLFINADPYSLFNMHDKVSQKKKNNLNFCTGNDFYGSSKKGRRKADKLLVHVCDCLYKCFLYDTEGFVTKERFDTLLQPLVDQVTDVNQSDSCFCQAVVNITLNFTFIVKHLYNEDQGKTILIYCKSKSLHLISLQYDSRLGGMKITPLWIHKKCFCCNRALPYL